MRRFVGIICGICISILLVVILVFCLYLVDKAGITYTKTNVIGLFGLLLAASLIVSFFFRKRLYFAITQISFTVLLLIGFFAFVWQYNDTNRHDSIWDSKDDNFTTGFIVGKEGHLYIKASINNIKGLFLFDTGADICLVNEKLILGDNKSTRFFSITDAKKIKQSKRIIKIKNFQLGSINIDDLQVYPVDSISWINLNGAFYNQDSVIGVIGNNIIANYVWDFDMLNKTVTVSKSKKYCKDLPDSSAVDLIHKGNPWHIPVIINDTKKELILDFGCSSPLDISDTITTINKFNIKGITYSQYSGSAFNHLDPNKEMETHISFVDVSFGDKNFRRVKCSEKTELNLFGIPFIWAFERVVLNFKDDKAYFISKLDSAGTFGVNEVSKRSRDFALAVVLVCQGKAEVTLRNDIKTPVKWISSQNDTLNGEYTFYGNIVFYGGKKDPKIDNYSIDSIVSKDSLMLPNGAIRYGHYTVDYNKKYHFERNSLGSNVNK